MHRRKRHQGDKTGRSLRLYGRGNGQLCELIYCPYKCSKNLEYIALSCNRGFKAQNLIHLEQKWAKFVKKEKDGTYTLDLPAGNAQGKICRIYALQSRSQSRSWYLVKADIALRRALQFPQRTPTGGRHFTKLSSLCHTYGQVVILYAAAQAAN